MTQPSPLNEQERADLVAYLDGELAGERAKALEARLSLDPAVRAEADALRRAWDLLDFLPRAAPSPNFTNRTLDRLAPVTKGRPAAAPALRARWRPWLFGVGWAAAVLLAGALGYAGVSFTASRDQRAADQDLERDLRIIENKRFYDRVDDLDFLRQLDQPDLFGDDSIGS